MSTTDNKNYPLAVLSESEIDCLLRLNDAIKAIDGDVAALALAIVAAKNDAIETIMGGATQAELDTIKELGERLNDDADAIAAIMKTMASKADIQKPNIFKKMQTFAAGIYVKSRRIVFNIADDADLSSSDNVDCIWHDDSKNRLHIVSDMPIGTEGKDGKTIVEAAGFTSKNGDVLASGDVATIDSISSDDNQLINVGVFREILIKGGVDIDVDLISEDTSDLIVSSEKYFHAQFLLIGAGGGGRGNGQEQKWQHGGRGGRLLHNCLLDEIFDITVGKAVTIPEDDVDGEEGGATKISFKGANVEYFASGGKGGLALTSPIFAMDGSGFKTQGEVTEPSAGESLAYLNRYGFNPVVAKIFKYIDVTSFHHFPAGTTIGTNLYVPRAAITQDGNIIAGERGVAEENPLHGMNYSNATAGVHGLAILLKFRHAF